MEFVMPELKFLRQFTYLKLCAICVNAGVYMHYMFAVHLLYIMILFIVTNQLHITHLQYRQSSSFLLPIQHFVPTPVKMEGLA